MKNLLKDLYNHKIMTKEEAKNVLFSLTDGSANNSQIASFLTVFLMREITVEELDGFKEAMIEMVLKLDIDNENLIDLCGTRKYCRSCFCYSSRWTCCSFLDVSYCNGRYDNKVC